ncbi:helix-turn-helix domain-containing protein [Streptomyces sp. NPDC015220]|uniref:AraC-like ligand-binding domain-containing protein n=1 Tax=Streptomyces sp. NPDC015220 TaxID=3364947 RepID=UPI0036FD2C8F
MSPDSPAAEPEEALSGTLYTTDAVPIHQRRTYWRAALSRTLAAVELVVPDEDCSGTVRTSRLGHLKVATVDGGPLEARRTVELIAPGEDEHLVVMLLVRGTAVVEQDARVAHLGPGQIVFCDTARPSRMEFPGPFRTKSLLLPRRLLGLAEPDLRRLTATAVRPDTTLGSLLSPFLTRFVDTAATYPPDTGEALARNVIDLLSVLVEERLRQDTDDPPSAAKAWLSRIQAHIDRHLADSDLTPQAIAHAHQISVRYLHRLFQEEDITLGRWIQRRRLQECRRELARRDSEGRTIAAVARRWGFHNAAHFSRVFRAAYGMSPAEWRDSALREPRTIPPAEWDAPAVAVLDGAGGPALPAAAGSA